MNRLLKWTAIPLASLILSACSDPKAPTVENYKSAIQKALDAQQDRICFVITRSMDIYSSEDYPFTFNISTENVPNSRHLKLLNSWVKRGVLELKKSTEQNGMSYFDYDYSDLAKKAYKIEGRKVCIVAKKVLDEIIQVSEPMVDSFDGETSVSVVANYKLTNLPDWAKDNEGLAIIGKNDYNIPGFANGDEEFKTIIEEKYKLVLMHDGWVERSQLK